MVKDSFVFKSNELNILLSLAKLKESQNILIKDLRIKRKELYNISLKINNILEQNIKNNLK